MSRFSERLENFNKSYSLYTLSVNAYKADKSNMLMHLALIQAYEVCFELCWKVLKDYLKENKGIIVLSPKDTIKEAYSAEIIEDGQLWIDMLNDRNLSSHEYNMDKTDIILENVSTKYYDEITKFKEWAGKINE